MDIYKFFASREIAEYCMSIGHTFNSVEKAVLVALSDNPIREKLSAWQELVDSFPDMQIHGNHVVSRKESLHAYLRSLIVSTENTLKQFYTPGAGVVYQVEVCVSTDRNTLPTGCFSTVKKALESYKNDWDWDKDSISHITVNRLVVDSPKCDKVCVNRNDEPTHIYIDGEYPSELSDIFIDIPMPFSKGDLVLVGDKPCVLESLPHWITTGNLSYDCFVSGELGDGFDKQAGFYYIDEHGHFTWEHGSYLGMRKFTGELEGRERFLRYVSSFISKGESPLSLPTMLNAFMSIKSEEDGKDYGQDLFRFPSFLEE